MNVHSCARSWLMVTLAAGSLATSGHAQSPTLPGWRLVWSEEFQGTALSPTKWRAENVAWPYNNELEYYLPSQASVGLSQLNIKAERRNFGGRNYVSARINTSGFFAQQYGRFEARMKVPAGQGFWPAFWLLPATNAWPPEIDIMETIGSLPSTVYLTHHWGTAANVMSYGTTFTGPNFTTSYHRYAVEWSPTRVDWLVDGVVRFSSTANFPHEPMYIILNLAVGGTLPGNPTPSTVFPQSLLVDWVRVYQRDLPLLNPSLEQLNTNGTIANWQTFGNAQSSSTWSSDGTRSLRLFGIAGAGPYYAGAFQDLPASPGQMWTLSGVVRHNTTDRLTTGNFVDLKIEWYNRFGVQISNTLVRALADTSATDVAIPVSVQGAAPAGTTSARAAIVYVQPTSGAGSAYVDALSFTYASPAPVSVCLADFNGVNGVGVQDIFDFLAAWFAGDPIADINEIDGITVQDIFDFLALWFRGCQ